MKRIMAAALIICMMLTLASCSSQEKAKGAKTNQQTETDGAKHILTAYFSCTGTTEQIAGWIADKTDSDIYQITPQSPYNKDDLNYGDSSSRTMHLQDPRYPAG